MGFPVKIEKNLVCGKGGKMIYKVPKTDTSIREIKLPSFVIEALQDQQKRSWKKHGILPGFYQSLRVGTHKKLKK